MTTEASEGAPVAQKTESNRLDPWIEDGNVVLAVQGKYFRVHRSILSSYSVVFKDMFANCRKPAESEGEKEPEELIEQCPVIHLHDAVTDVQIMLRAMYDRGYPLPYYEKIPLSVVSAFLHLGEKYDIERLTEEGKARLCCAFESTLNVAVRMTSSTGTFCLFPGITGGDPHNFLVMNLLREMGLNSPLPLAMYQCVIACPLTTIVDGYKFQGSLCSLSHANLQSWILMKNILEQFRIRLAQNLRVSSNCVVQSSCVLHVRRIWSDDATVTQPFGAWRHEWDKLFCDACRSDLNAWRNAAIQKAWNQIPTAFGFGSWVDVANNTDDFPSLVYK